MAWIVVTSGLGRGSGKHVRTTLAFPLCTLRIADIKLRPVLLRDVFSLFTAYITRNISYHSYEFELRPSLGPFHYFRKRIVKTRCGNVAQDKKFVKKYKGADRVGSFPRN